MSSSGPSDRGVVPLVQAHASTLFVDGKTVVYDEDEHSMLMLNTSAGAVWSLCDGTKTLGDIVDELAAVHGTGADRILDDVWETVCKLAALGLVADARTAPSPAG